MMPRWWRLGAGLGGLGALAVAPYLAGACVLVALGLPLADVEYRLALRYWQALAQPELAPYAARIRYAAVIGASVLPTAWALLAWCGWRRAEGTPKAVTGTALRRARELHRERAWRSRREPLLGRDGWRRVALPTDHSLLIAAPGYPASHEALRGIVRDVRGPMLVIDMEGALHASTAGWRATHGPVRRLTPFGGDHPWNPLAHAWRQGRLLDERVAALAAQWYPPHRPDESAVVTHVRSLFVALAGALDDILRAADTPVPPAPGDLWRLFEPATAVDAFRDRLRMLAATEGVGPERACAIEDCATMDDDSLRRVIERWREPLAMYADETIDAHTRGVRRAPASGTTYLHIPYEHRHIATPVIEAAVAQWLEQAGEHADATIVIHALDLYPALPLLAGSTEVRCIATTRNTEKLLHAYGDGAHRVARRFDALAIHRPENGKQGRREAAAVAHLLQAHDARLSQGVSVDAEALGHLGRHEQALIVPAVGLAVRCRTSMPRSHAPHPFPEIHGEVMAFPKPLATLLAASRAGTCRAADLPVAPT